MQKGLQNDLNTQDNLFFKAQKVKPEKKKKFDADWHYC